MAKKINRADILTAMNKQLHVAEGSMGSMEGSGILMVNEEIQPVIDISRPSKIPYQDWTSNTQITGNLLAARAEKRLVITHLYVTAMNTATDTGTDAGIIMTINGATYYPIYMKSPTLTVFNQSQSFSGELVCDENTVVGLVSNGSWGYIRGSAAGYYIDT